MFKFVLPKPVVLSEEQKERISARAELERVNTFYKTETTAKSKKLKDVKLSVKLYKPVWERADGGFDVRNVIILSFGAPMEYQFDQVFLDAREALKLNGKVKFQLFDDIYVTQVEIERILRGAKAALKLRGIPIVSDYMSQYEEESRR